MAKTCALTRCANQRTCMKISGEAVVAANEAGGGGRLAMCGAQRLEVFFGDA